MIQRAGRYTQIFTTRPIVAAYASTVGKKEGEGPLADQFDTIQDDNTFGEKTWEKSESRMQKDTVSKALEKAGITAGNVDYLFAGDLLNQCIGSTFGLREFNIPFFGLFGACSTMAESLGLASLMVEANAASTCVAVTSSHFCTAERQFRMPLEYGGQRPPSAQWTATACGATVVRNTGSGPFVSGITTGKIVDLGIKDANNMGAAMAPAAADTIKTFFDDTGKSPSEFDLIITGDLGEFGSKLLADLLQKEGITLGKRQADCGLMIYDQKKQDVHAGASGCGCSAAVLCSYLLNNIKSGKLKEVLFIGTGALMSTTSSQQGESIPGIAHLVWLSAQ